MIMKCYCVGVNHMTVLCATVGLGSKLSNLTKGKRWME